MKTVLVKPLVETDKWNTRINRFFENVIATADNHFDQHLMPRAESLHQTQKRLMPYYYDHIASRLMNGEDQLIVAHGSSLRALIKKLEQINDHDIVKLEVPNAEPIVYTMDEHLKIINKQILRK